MFNSLVVRMLGSTSRNGGRLETRFGGHGVEGVELGSL